jgi:peptidoglycan/LPS O-acetylase OafA/YrhL
MSHHTNTRFQYIDALRGIAILEVIIAHADTITQYHSRFGAIGTQGVQLFFVISAFTVFFTLTKHAEEEYTPIAIRNFFIRRLFRIIPVYWFGIILYTCIFGTSSRGWLPGPQLWHYPLHLTLINLLHPETQSSVVPGGWSISCEVLFYLSVPLWFFTIRSISRAYILVLFSTLCLPIFTLFLRQILTPIFSHVDANLLTLYWQRFPTNQLGSFSFGILLFYLLKHENFMTIIRRKNINLISICFVCFLILLTLIVKIKFLLEIHVYAMLFMLLAVLLAAKPWGIFVNKFTIFMGKISYSAYLLHFLVLYFITNILSGWIPFIKDKPGLFFIVVTGLGILLTIPLARLGYLFIEQPTIRLSKMLIVQWESKNK